MEASPRDIADPVGGQRWVFRRTGADTNGELLEADFYVTPGGFVREHVHPTQEETFTGVSGTFVLDVGGEAKRIGPGDHVVIPPRTRHGFREAAEDAHLIVQVRPALHLDDYFRTFLGLSRDHRIRMPVNGLPGPLLDVALLLDRFAPEIAAARVPIRLQRPLLWALARIAGLFGRKSSYPEYGAP
jgi:quercetin dioxygenase-like cupin family protein